MVRLISSLIFFELSLYDGEVSISREGSKKRDDMILLLSKIEDGDSRLKQKLVFGRKN